MGLKDKPKNIIYNFYDTDQNGEPAPADDTPLPFLGGMLGGAKKLFDQGGALSGGRRESFGGGGNRTTQGGVRQIAGDQLDAMTAREDMNTTLSSIDFKDAINNPSTVKTRGTLGFLGNRSARKRRRADGAWENQDTDGPGTLSRAEAESRGVGWNSARAAAEEAAGSTATPTEQPEPTSSPEGNEGIKTTGGPTGAINIPTPPKVPTVGTRGGLEEGDYKLTKI